MYRINEDVAKSNKVLKEIESLNIDSLEIEKLKKVIEELKEYLVKNNSVGYLGVFTQMLYNMSKIIYLSSPYREGSYERHKYSVDPRVYKDHGGKSFKISEHTLLADFISVYRRMQENKDIIKNLRDRDGNLIKIEDCETLHKLEDCLDDLSRWRTFNNFIKGFPKDQKDLIWENGYFKKNLKEKHIYKLYQAVEGIIQNSRQDVFLRKVSNIKTTKDMVYNIINMGAKGIPWDIDEYLNEINKSNDVKIIYNKDNYLILKIDSAKEVVKYCGDTAWCIRREGTFRGYYRTGDFFALLDFNKNSSDNLSKVGMTYRRGVMSYCQNKSDRNIDYRTLGLSNVKEILEDYEKSVKIDQTDNAVKIDQTDNKTNKKSGILGRIKNWIDYHYGDMEL